MSSGTGSRRDLRWVDASGCRAFSTVSSTRFVRVSGRFAARDAVESTSRADERLSTVYLDSEDLRLARWGVSFRYRAGEGWTVKLPGEDTGPLLVRDELVFQGSPGRPPPEAVDLVHGYLRGAALRPRVRLRTVRRGVLLHDREGRLVADVVDDTVSVLDGRRTTNRLLRGVSYGRRGAEVE